MLNKKEREMVKVIEEQIEAQTKVLLVQYREDRIHAEAHKLTTLGVVLNQIRGGHMK